MEQTLITHALEDILIQGPRPGLVLKGGQCERSFAYLPRDFHFYPINPKLSTDYAVTLPLFRQLLDIITNTTRYQGILTNIRDSVNLDRYIVNSPGSSNPCNTGIFSRRIPASLATSQLINPNDLRPFLSELSQTLSGREGNTRDDHETARDLQYGLFLSIQNDLHPWTPALALAYPTATTEIEKIAQAQLIRYRNLIQPTFNGRERIGTLPGIIAFTGLLIDCFCGYSDLIRSQNYGMSLYAGSTLSTESLYSKYLKERNRPSNQTDNALLLLAAQTIKQTCGGAGSLAISEFFTRIEQADKDIIMNIGAQLAKSMLSRIINTTNDHCREATKTPLRLFSHEAVITNVGLTIDALAIMLEKVPFAFRSTTAESQTASILSDHFIMLSESTETGNITALQALKACAYMPGFMIQAAPSRGYLRMAFDSFAFQYATWLYLNPTFSTLMFNDSSVEAFMSSELFILQLEAIRHMITSQYSLGSNTVYDFPIFNVTSKTWGITHAAWKPCLEAVTTAMQEKLFNPRGSHYMIPGRHIRPLLNVCESSATGMAENLTYMTNESARTTIRPAIAVFFNIESRYHYQTDRISSFYSPYAAVIGRRNDMEMLHWLRLTSGTLSVAPLTAPFMGMYSYNGAFMAPRPNATTFFNDNRQHLAETLGMNEETIEELNARYGTRGAVVPTHTLYIATQRNEHFFEHVKLLLVAVTEDVDRLRTDMIVGGLPNPKYFRILYDTSLDALRDLYPALNNMVLGIQGATNIPVIRMDNLAEYAQSCLTTDIAVNESL